MLTQLCIHDFTLIADAVIPFGAGFTAITGETGAGKSVLLQALRTACGDKTTAGMIRFGAEKAWVEAHFEIKDNPRIQKILNDLDIDEDDLLVIRREILSGGKNRARVNGVSVNLTDLQTLGDALVQMHGQSEQTLLRDTRVHVQMLDEYCGNACILEEYKEKWNAWNHAVEESKALKQKAQALAEQKEFLAYQHRELEKAALKENEETALEEIVAVASKNEAEGRLLKEINHLIHTENGVADQFQTFQSKVKTLAVKIPDYEALHQELQEMFHSFNAICKSFQNAGNAPLVDARELDKANARLAQIQGLKRKYKTDLNGLLALCEKRKAELECLENLDADLDFLKQKELKIFAELQAVADKLTLIRTGKAGELDKAVESHLHELGMPKARFKTEIQNAPYSASGKDAVEFKIAPNQGEGEKSLQKAVSGGELSRVLLAFKSVMAASDLVPVLIFDEVDSGISGEIGNKIGLALEQLGKYHQVLTITHLHQVASRAAGHIAVSKTEIDARTHTHISLLNAETRIREISRMLGDEKSETVRTHAKQLLEDSHAFQ